MRSLAGLTCGTVTESSGRQAHRLPPRAFLSPFGPPAPSNPAAEPKRSGIIIRVSGVRVPPPASEVPGNRGFQRKRTRGMASSSRTSPTLHFGSGPSGPATGADNCVPPRVPQIGRRSATPLREIPGTVGPSAQQPSLWNLPRKVEERGDREAIPYGPGAEPEPGSPSDTEVAASEEDPTVRDR